MTTSGVQGALASRNPHRLNSRDPGGARGEALGATETGTLHSQSLAHDRAAATQNLQVGHGSASRAGARASSGRESAEGGGGCALEERAHSARLLQESLHD